jgi:hypothetical protein
MSLLSDTLLVYPLGVSLGVVPVPAYKVNVSLPPELVAAIDESAAEHGMTRSGFIAEASARYVVELEGLSAEEKRKRDIDRAMANMKELGKKIPKDFDYIAAIRSDRERDGWDGPE